MSWRAGRGGRRLIEAPEPSVDGTRLLQGLPERPDRVGVRDIVGAAEPEKAHEGQPVLDQELRVIVGQRMHRLKHQDFEHQNVIEGRPVATGPVRPRHSRLHRGAEYLEIDETLYALQIVALGGKLREPLININEPRSPLRDIRSPIVTWQNESIVRRFGERFLGGVYLAAKRILGLQALNLRVFVLSLLRAVGSETRTSYADRAS